jgi:6-methylsalicylate decarboxylase
MTKTRPEIDWGCPTCALRSTRRQFLAGLGALGSTALLPESSWGQTPSATEAFRIDVHHHFASPRFVAEMTSRSVGNPRYRQWTPQVSLDEMAGGAVATSILSTSRPGIWYGDAAMARSLSREQNDYGAQVVADYPGRFGLFATLPLPDVDGTLREIEYAYDKLNVDGVSVFSNHDGIYLGDPKFAPVMDELNRRRAIVYAHPIREDRENPMNGVELITDTTRAIVSLLYNRTVVDYPDIRFIFAHGGGTIAASASRMGGLEDKLPNGLMYELQRFYYDTGQAYALPLLASYKALVPVAQILFGTDFPFRGSIETAKGLSENGGFTATEMRAIDRENAVRLFPRFR